ncbi:hypothetical protein SYNPS1DRAFT_21717, partial [Syncephalis pseudoplumigaleata]
MARLLSELRQLPARVLWRIVVYLDDKALLPFLTTCFHVLGPVDPKEIDWERWFFRRFPDDLDIRAWLEWHDQLMDQEDNWKLPARITSPEALRNARWLRTAIARLDLEQNWHNGIRHHQRLPLASALNLGAHTDEETTSPCHMRILASNARYTLLLTSTYALYSMEHLPR